MVVSVPAPVFGLAEPLEAPFAALPPPREAPAASSGLLETSASLCVERREPAGVFAGSAFEPALRKDPAGPRADALGGSAGPTRAAALELRGRPPAAAADLGVAAADLGVSTGVAVALVFSLRCRLPPPDTDAGVCSPSAARLRVFIRRSVGKYVLHSFGFSRLCCGVHGRWVRNRARQNTRSSKRVAVRCEDGDAGIREFGCTGREKTRSWAYPSRFFSSRS